MSGIEQPIQPEHAVAHAAQESAEATADAIDTAARLNDDPKVADALDEAAIGAQQTASRVSWLRGFLDRFRPKL